MKILPCGVAVVEGDTHIAKWVEQSNTLKIAAAMLEPFKQYVPEGGIVYDIGANIGDHAATYAEWVGIHGVVYAFEPNPTAFECLEFNSRPPIMPMQVALSDKDGLTSLVISDNVGASHLVDVEGTIPTFALDHIDLQSPNFIKIDVEGYETKVLRGGVECITNCKPVMLIEVNEGALVRAGSSVAELLDLIESYGYNMRITDASLKYTYPQYDIICLPNKTH